MERPIEGALYQNNEDSSVLIKIESVTDEAVFSLVINYGTHIVDTIERFHKLWRPVE